MIQPMTEVAPTLVWRETPLGPQEVAQINGREIPVCWRAFPGRQRVAMRVPQVISGTPLLELLLEGGRGGGKSELMLQDFLQHVGLGFGAAYRGVIFRRSFKQLDELVRKSKRLFKAVFPTARYVGSASMRKWIFETGEELEFRIFNRPDDYDNYHGQEYNFIGWDELTRWPTLEGYKRMMSCCRSGHPGIILQDGSHVPMPRKVRATTNPYGVGHNAVKQRWELPGRRSQILYEDIEITPGNFEKIGRMSLQLKLEENIAIMKHDPGYLARTLMAAKNDAERRAWQFADWDITAGGMFDAIWQGAEHSFRDIEVPHNWRIDRSFDWGWSKPFSVLWFAESDGSDVKIDGHMRPTIRGDLFIIKEWYGCRPNSPNEGLEMPDGDIAKGIIEREERWWPRKRIYAGPADGAIFTAQSGNNSIAKNMEDAGVRWSDAADKSRGSRVSGWSVMRERLDAALPKGRARENPGLFVSQDCKDWIRTVTTLPRDDVDQDDVDTDSEDHAGDATRYRLVQKRRGMSVSKLA